MYDCLFMAIHGDSLGDYSEVSSFRIGFQCKAHTVGTQLIIGVGDFNPYGFISFQPGSENGSSGSAEGIEDSPARYTDFHKVTHELQGLFRHMNSVLRIGVTEHTGQTANRSIHRHRTIGTPYDVFTLLAEEIP